RGEESAPLVSRATGSSIHNVDRPNPTPFGFSPCLRVSVVSVGRVSSRGWRISAVNLLHIRTKPKRRPHGDPQAVAALGQQVIEEIDVNVIKAQADADMPGRVDIEPAAHPEERFQVALLPSRRQ